MIWFDQMLFDHDEVGYPHVNKHYERLPPDQLVSCVGQPAGVPVLSRVLLDQGQDFEHLVGTPGSEAGLKWSVGAANGQAVRFQEGNLVVTMWFGRHPETNETGLSATPSR